MYLELRSGQGEHREGDQFDSYRKRMMASYKHRPNPMVWPLPHHPTSTSTSSNTVFQKNPRRDY